MKQAHRHTALSQPPAPAPACKASTLYRLAAQARGKTIGLYGGSFNPPHAGHLHIARTALRVLDLDEIWMMPSPGNPLKSGHFMAPYTERYEKLEQLTRTEGFIKSSPVEHLLGTRRSYDTLRQLMRAMPRTRFLWIMGADNMAGFHLWYKWHQIVTTLPIAIFDRPGYSESGFSGYFSRRFRKSRTHARILKNQNPPAWSFVHSVRHPASATMIRRGDGANWVAHPLYAADKKQEC